jgi:hypothetical protein
LLEAMCLMAAFRCLHWRVYGCRLIFILLPPSLKMHLLVMHSSVKASFSGCVIGWIEETVMPSRLVLSSLMCSTRVDIRVFVSKLLHILAMAVGRAVVGNVARYSCLNAKKISMASSRWVAVLSLHPRRMILGSSPSRKKPRCSSWSFTKGRENS